MNTRKEIILDRYVAKPFAFILNFFVRILGVLLSINHDLNKKFKRIAICKFKGMGSIIQATPMISAIRQKYPDAEIIFISTKSNIELLKKIHHIDTIVTIDESSLFRFILTNINSIFFLIKKHPEVYIDLEIYSDYSTLFTTFTISKNRIGFYLRSSSFRMGIYTHMMFFNPRVPISNVYLQIARLLKCDTSQSSLYSFEENKKNKNKKYIIINPNASDLRLERRWGKNNFINLITLVLKKYPNYDIILIGSKSERSYTTGITKELSNERVKNTAGLTSLDDLINLISNAKVMITNDTGPMHIAFCTNTPVVSLFGPCSPNQYGKSEKTISIYKKVYCSPCVHDFEVPPCKGNNLCMKLITVDEVFNKFEKILNSPDKVIINTKDKFIYEDDNNILGKVIR